MNITKYYSIAKRKGAKILLLIVSTINQKLLLIFNHSKEWSMSLESLSIQTMTRQIKFIRSDKKLSVIVTVVVAGILVSILEKKSRVLMEELPDN